MNDDATNPPGPGGVIHKTRRGTPYTACAIFVPDLPAGDRYWTPHEQDAGRDVIGPTTCPHCIAGRPAPLCSTDPRALTMWTVYAHPRDFPGEFVAREWKASRGRTAAGEMVARAADLDGCRRALDLHLRRDGRGGLEMLHRIAASVDDDRTIVETWI